MKTISFKKVLASVAALAMTASLPALAANAVTQTEPVNVTIDRRTVTVDEAKAGVLIYVKVDTALLNAIEFGTHVDDRCTYVTVADKGTLGAVPDSAAEGGVKGEISDMLIKAQDSTKSKNVTWFALSSTEPDITKAVSYEKGTFESMNLIALYVIVPESEAIPGTKFDITYMAEGVTGSDGDASKHIWKNTASGTFGNVLTGQVTFEPQDYVELNLVNPVDGWIQIETTTAEETTTTEEQTTTTTEQTTTTTQQTTTTTEKTTTTTEETTTTTQQTTTTTEETTTSTAKTTQTSDTTTSGTKASTTGTTGTTKATTGTTKATAGTTKATEKATDKKTTSSSSGSPKTGVGDVLPIAGAAAAVAVLGGVALVSKKKND